MASGDVADRDVTPDSSLLEHIFGNNLPSSTSIVLQNWDKCVFKASFSDAVENERHLFIVRLEAQDSKSSDFTMVTAMQKVAASCIPPLVPETLKTGTAANKQGREFHFCVMELVEGVTLEEAWDGMAGDNRSAVVTEIVDALSKLHTVRLSDTNVQTILRRELGEESEEVLYKAVLGGPSTGLLNDGLSLLSSIEQKWKLQRPFHTTEPVADPKGLLIKSAFEDVGSATVSDSDMEQWPKEAVFCHNDLTPRNLILRATAGSDGTTNYRLFAIIDWELAGFYPSSYELSLQDTYLSGSNRHIAFYSLLKERIRDITPPSPSQVALLRAMELIFESQQRRLLEGANIPAHIRKRFREMLQLSRDEDTYRGWKRNAEGGTPLELSRDRAQKLEDEVVAEMIARRRANAK